MWRVIGRLLLLAGGLGLCGWLLRQVDPRTVAEGFQKIGWLLPLALTPYLAVYVSDTLGWRFSFGSRGPAGVSFLNLFRIRWCGESLNNLVPSAYVGGEALKIFLLRKLGVGVREATAAAVVSKCVQTLAQILFIAGAALAFRSLLPDGSPVRSGLLTVTLGGLCVAIGMFFVQIAGVFGILIKLSSWTGLASKLTAERRKTLQQIDESIRTFYRTERLGFLGSIAGYLGGWLIDTLEIWLFAALMGSPITWIQALSIEAFVGVAKIMGMFVPGALGIQESGILFLGRAAGLTDPFCLTYAVFRRLRELLFIAAGWALFSLQGVSLSEVRDKPSTAR